jgi:hypothetical protein
LQATASGNGITFGRSIRASDYLGSMIVASRFIESYISPVGRRFVGREATRRLAVDFWRQMEEVLARETFATYWPSDDLVGLALLRIQGEMALQLVEGEQERRAREYPQ